MFSEPGGNATALNAGAVTPILNASEDAVLVRPRNERPFNIEQQVLSNEDLIPCLQQPRGSPPDQFRPSISGSATRA